MNLKDLKGFFDPDPENLNYRPDWKSMSAGDRASYIWMYYKIPIIIGVVILYFIGYWIARWVTRTNEILYTGSVNLVLSGEQQHALTDAYTSDPARGFGKRDRVSFTDMGFISDDPNAWVSPVAGATQVKLLASIAADQLDVVFMDQAAFDIFSADDALLDLEALAEGRIEFESGDGSDSESTGNEVSQENMTYLAGISGSFVENTVSGVEGEDGEKSPDTRKWLGIDMTDNPLFQGAGFDGPVYAGILAQSSRIDESIDYLQYVREGK